MTDWLRHAKPSDEELRRLALRETDPRHHRRFEPIARGRVFAVAALLVVVALSAPFVLARICRGRWRARDEGH